MEDGLYHSSRALRIPGHALRPYERPRYLPILYEQGFPGYDQQLSHPDLLPKGTHTACAKGSLTAP